MAAVICKWYMVLLCDVDRNTCQGLRLFVTSVVENSTVDTWALVPSRFILVTFSPEIFSPTQKLQGMLTSCLYHVQLLSVLVKYRSCFPQDVDWCALFVFKIICNSLSSLNAWPVGHWGSGITLVWKVRGTKQNFWFDVLIKWGSVLPLPKSGGPNTPVPPKIMPVHWGQWFFFTRLFNAV